MKQYGVFALAAVCFGFWSWSGAQADGQRFITVGTGGVTGVYYPTGGAICRLVNKGRRDHGIRCSVESTSGSAENIKGIQNGDLEMGIAQSDVQVSALNGVNEFADSGAFTDLRSLFSVHSELIQIVTRADSAIASFDDLKGKRVNLGNVGSGQRATSELLLAQRGWTTETFSKIMELRSAEQSRALCDNQVDAMFFTAGIPNASVKEAAVTCASVLVPLSGPWVDDFLKNNPAYAKGVIPAETYIGTDAPVRTIGPKAVVLTSIKMPDDVAYEIVKAVFENLGDFKTLHPAFEHLTKAEMVKDGLAAPLHPGALRYYQDVGLLP